MNLLDKWGVLTVRNLHSLLYEKISLSGLRRKLHRLAKDDYVHISKIGNNHELIAIPTRKTIGQLKSNRSSIDETMIYHNLFISLLGIELIYRENVMFFKLPHEYRKSRTPVALSSSIEPDAYLGVNHNGDILKIAIEIELTQKSSDRIYDKFKQYKESQYFSYVIYFFRDQSTLVAYRKRLNEMLNEIKSENDRKLLSGKIIFLCSAQNYQYGSILDNSTMECLGKQISNEKFFGLSTTIKEEAIDKTIC
jgi:hypothetical protein